ncbi:MAG TPA: H-X9-DG-CTERM domain-containing protein [Isosphaeraceae bacterium]|jgi:prepilin-type processing-associated H-X9-DG protein|nr:H-X9-DG-CTERM domain-containing protein [Isosphaeraceae bacterium]
MKRELGAPATHLDCHDETGGPLVFRSRDRSTRRSRSFDHSIDTFESAASSFHPGGVNVGFADGSVRFIKDSVSTLAFSQSTGLPNALIATPNGNCTNSAPIYSFQPGTQLGVWQALSTRAGGEVVSADSY